VLSASVDSQFVHKIWDENELSRMTEGSIPFHPAPQAHVLRCAYALTYAIQVLWYVRAYAAGTHDVRSPRRRPAPTPPRLVRAA